MSRLELSRCDRDRARIARRFSRVGFDLGWLVSAIGAGALPLSAVVPWMLRQAWLVVFRGSSS